MLRVPLTLAITGLLALAAPAARASCPRINVHFKAADGSACGVMKDDAQNVLTPFGGLGPFLECGALHPGGGSSTTPPERGQADFYSQFIPGDISTGMEHCEDPANMPFVSLFTGDSPTPLGPPIPLVLSPTVGACVLNRLYGFCIFDPSQHCIRDSDCSPGAGQCWRLSTGGMNAFTGSMRVGISFTADAYVTTSDADPSTPQLDPCPLCKAGVCTGGPDEGATCLPEAASGVSSHCPPDGLFSTHIPIGADLRNSPTTLTAGSMTQQTNVFCGYCALPSGGTFRIPATSCASDDACIPYPPYTECRQQHAGAFGSPAAVTITENGTAAGDVTDGQPHATILSSVFCIPTTFSLVDEAVDLPGPGALALAADLSLTTACGDHVVNPGEECDDGNLVNGDACEADCTLPRCGNGITDQGEQCDDGNQDDTDDCPGTCVPSNCGDGLVHSHGTPPFESCDDGAGNGSDGCCSAACESAQPNEVCKPVAATGDTTLTNGSVSLTIPAGTMAPGTPVSITQVSSGTSGFGIGKTSVTGNLIALVQLGPPGQGFPANNPAKITFEWSDAGLTCQDTVTGKGFSEDQMYVWHNQAQLSGTNKCGAQASKPMTCAATCPQNCGTCASGFCCDMDANTWTVPVTSFSEFALGVCLPLADGALVLDHLGTPPGDDTLRLRGEVALDVPIDPALDPVSNGLRLRVDDATGASVLDVTLPPGSYANGHGWRAHPAPRRWTYADNTTAAPGGVYRVVVRELSPTSPGHVRVTARGHHGAYAASTLPLIAGVALAPPFGQCAEARFAASATSPSCTLAHGGATVRCR